MENDRSKINLEKIVRLIRDEFITAKESLYGFGLLINNKKDEMSLRELNGYHELVQVHGTSLTVFKEIAEALGVEDRIQSARKNYLKQRKYFGKIYDNVKDLIWMRET